MSARAPGGAVGSLVRRLRRETPRSTAQRVVRRLHARLGAAELDFPLLPGDVADSTRLAARAPAPRDDGRHTVGFLCTPPSRGSGGHTTMFRMVKALEERGHRCVVLLYDRHGGDAVEQAAVVRAGWPWVAAEVRSVDDGFADLDACVATGWPTAHVLASRAPDDVHLLYLVQDYEPFFFPRGSEHELAADTYRFGFTNVALGHMVQDRLRVELAVGSELIPFSVDTSVYHLHNVGARSGIVFYTKPDVARRGYRLAALALEEFHRRHPEQPIHTYGDEAAGLTVPVVRHDRMSPEDLNALYNRSVAGFAMSFTNISLVAEEMLASGCVPIVNDHPDARADLDNPRVAWSLPTPGALADTLCRVVEGWTAGTAVAAAGSVRRDGWEVPGTEFAAIVERVVRGQALELSGAPGSLTDRAPRDAPASTPAP
ncbi:glycosyltransferase family 1 protein [Nocardioides panacihumi]|uniref:Glycosyltransferase family 1 protein n=1 Tax=Nocardioides panacihumi TaxID=400774 RepID=A0ABN2RHU2_9ACTN